MSVRSCLWNSKSTAIAFGKPFENGAQLDPRSCVWYTPTSAATHTRWKFPGSTTTAFIGIEGSPAVLALFRRDPFNGKPPSQVRTVLWQYWFTDWATKRATGAWWRRQEIGLFSGVLTRTPDGRFTLSESP